MFTSGGDISSDLCATPHCTETPAAAAVTVFLCALPDRRAKWSLNEMLFMCWTRETGVIPAALAGLLLGMKAPGVQMIASVTFIAILMTILIQAPTTKWLGKRLGLLGER